MNTLLWLAFACVWMALLPSLSDAVGDTCATWLESNYCNANLKQAAIAEPSATVCPGGGCTASLCCVSFHVQMRIKGQRGHVIMGNDGDGDDYASVGRRGADLVLRTTSVNGTIIAGNDVSVNGDIHATGSISVGGTSEPTVTIRGDGKVGIGTEAPSAALDVVGDIAVSGVVRGKPDPIVFGRVYRNPTSAIVDFCTSDETTLFDTIDIRSSAASAWWSANPNSFTVPVSGWYRHHISAACNRAGADGHTWLSLKLDNVHVAQVITPHADIEIGVATQMLDAVVFATTGQKFTVHIDCSTTAQTVAKTSRQNLHDMPEWVFQLDKVA